MTNISLLLYVSTLYCNIKKMHATFNLKFMSQSMRITKKKETMGKISEQKEISSGVRTECEEERKLEKQNERDSDEDRERETRETKGMWSSRSLCLAALWLKQRVPGERGGSRPAQSVLSLSWSPECRPQKHTTKPSERASFYCTGFPIGCAESAKQAQIVMAPAPLNLEEGGLPRMSCCLDVEELFWCFNEDISHISKSVLLHMNLSTSKIR